MVDLRTAPWFVLLSLAGGVVLAALLVSGAILTVHSVLTAGDEVGRRDPRLGRNEKFR